MKLNRLKLENFKGIKSFEEEFDGKDIRITGTNGIGKTTIYDSFLWLLTGKNSNGDAQFDLKTKIDGEVQHGLNHSVEAELELDDGSVKTLQKIYREKWQSSRGSSEKSLSGHETECFIDSVPTKKGDFDDAIHEIIDESILKLLTSPTYFNEQLHWKDRRKILVKYLTDITFENVIESDEDLEDLPDILGDTDVDDYKKVVSNRKKSINDKREELRVRVDENEKNLPKREGDKKELEEEIDQLNKKIDDKNEEITRLKSGGEVAEIKKQISEIDSQIIDAKNKARNQAEEGVKDKKKDLSELKDKRDNLDDKVRSYKGNINSLEEDIDNLTSKCSELRDEWFEVDNEEPEVDVESVCPTCEQDLPPSEVEEAKEKAIKQFNEKHSEKLEKLQRAGKAKKDILEDKKDELEQKKEKKGELETQLKNTKESIEELKEEIKKISTEPDFSEANTLIERKAELKDKKKEIDEDISGELSKLNSALQDIKEEKSDAELKLRTHTDRAKGEKRIEECKEEEEKLKKEFDKLDRHEYLLDQYTMAEANLLEKQVNDQFKIAGFKLFDKRLNGSIVETCVTTYDGVPYDSGLNHGHQIVVGLDIIRTLSKIYGKETPVFVDNAEAIDAAIMPDMPMQTILLHMVEGQELDVAMA